MKDNKEAKKELISEIKKLRKRIDKLEALEAEHKHVEEEQRERTKLYRTVLQKLPDIVYRIDPDGHFTFISNSVRILGYEPEELVGKHFSKVIHPDDVKSFSRFITLPKHKGKVTGDKNRPKLIDERRTGKRKTKDLEVRLIPKTFGRRKKDLKEKIGTVFTLGDVSATGFFEADIHEKNKKFLGTLGIIRDITERKQAEEKLRLFSQGVDSSIDGIAMGNPEGKIIYVNEAFVRMFGHSREKLIGKEISFIYPEDQLPKLEEALKATMKGGWIGELVGKRKNGELFPMMVSSSRVVDNEGKVIAHMASHRDITERKRIESKLKQNENMLRQIIDTTPNCIFVKDRNGMYLMVNKRMVELHSTTPEELVGKYDYEIAQKWFETVDYNEFRKAEQDVIDNKKTLFIIEEPFVYNDGTERWFQTTKIPFELEDNQNCLLVISTDITERKQAEEALRESEERFRNIYENALLGIFRTTPDGRILMANPALVKMLGFSSFEELAQRNLEEEGYEPQYDRSVFKKRIEREGQVSGLESAWLRPDGTTLYFRENARIVRNDAGDVLYYEGTVEDITERKKAEEKLRLFSQGVDSSIDGIAMGNPEGKIIYVNEAFVRMFGHSREKLIGKEISFIYPEDQLPKLEEALKATMKGGWTGELVGKRKNGELFPMMVSSSKVVDNEGKVIAHMASHRDITERKRVEEELIRMSDAVKMSTDSIVISDIEARIIDVNEATMKMYGTDNKKDLVGKTSFDLIAPEDREKALEGTEKVLEKGYLKDREYTIITKDSDRIPVEMSVSILKDTDGKPIGFVAITRDITERKRAEGALRESRDYLEKLTNSMWDAVFSVKMPERVIEWANDSFKLIGYEPEECISRTTEFLYPDKNEFVNFGSKLKNTLAAGKEILHTEQVLKRKNGEVFPAEITTTFFKKEGKVVNVTSIVRDITERKQAEELLKASEEKYRELVNTSISGVISADSQMKIILWNPGAEKIFVYTEKEMLGQSLVKIVPARFREAMKKGFAKFRKTNKSSITGRTLDLVGVRKNGTEIPVELIVSTRKSGETYIATAIVIDITERKLAEEELKQHQEMLETSERELKNFSRRILSIREEEKKNLSISLHHEVGSLAVALSSNLNNIEEEIKDNDLKGALEIIEKGKNMLGKVIRRLKKMAVDLRPPDLDITGLPDALRVYFSNITKQAGIGINFSVGVDYKRINDKAAITLYRIVQETINNVIKHSDAKQVKIELKSLKNRIELNVCDDGKGFDTGKSVRGAKMRMGIRGMREMAESLGGTFNIKSTPGQGTEITVTLPNIEKQKS